MPPLSALADTERQQAALLNEQAEPGSTATIFYAEYLVQSEFPDAMLDELHDLLMSYLGACTRAQS